MFNIEENLAQQNPQWGNSASDFGVSLAKKREVFEEILIKTEKSKLVLAISGVRRVGKSYLLKQIMKSLAEEKGVSPTNIFYFQFSNLTNKENIIHEMIELYLKKYANSARQIYVFLDEIQLVDYWQDQIKYFYDQKLNIKFVLTGSTSFFYKQKSKETLTGRIEKLRINSLNFFEYLNFKNFPSVNFDLKQYLENSENFVSTRADFFANSSFLRREFKKYLWCGQFPETAMNEVDIKSYISSYFDELINFDVPFFKQKLDRQLFLNFVKILCFDISEEFSLNNIAKSLDADRRVLKEYSQILEEIGLFKICLNSDFKSMRKKLAGSKKIYALNSNLALSANGFDYSYLNDNRVFGRYFENYCFMRLSQIFGDVQYFRRNSREVDFVTESHIFEVKSGEIKNIEKYQETARLIKKKLVFLTENEFEINKNYAKIPAIVI